MIKKRNICIIISVILYGIIRFSVVARGGLLGSAYFFNAYDFALLFMVSVPYAFIEIVSRHVREHMEIGSFRNARRVLYFSILISALYSLAVAFIILAFREGIAVGLLGSANSVLSLLMLLPMIIFMSLSCPFKGFFMGSGLKSKLYIAEAVEKTAMFVFSMLCEGIFKSYGAKASQVLFDVKVNNAFAVGGAAIGLSIGALIGFAVCVVLFIISSNTMITKDETRRPVDIYDLGVKITSEVIVLGLATVFVILPIVINQILFNHSSRDISSLCLYENGIFFGGFMTAIICPLVFTHVYSFLDRGVLRKAYLSGDRHELRHKTNIMIRQYFIYFIPVLVFIAVNSDIISESLYMYDSSLCAKICIMAVPAALLYGLCIIFMNVLCGINRLGGAIISGAVALAVDIPVGILLMFRLKLALTGLLIAFYIFTIVYLVMMLIFISSYLKFMPELLPNLIRPLLLGIGVAVVTLIFKLLLGFFAPAFVILIINLVITFMLTYMLYIKSGSVNYYNISKSPVNFILLPIGKLFGLNKNK